MKTWPSFAVLLVLVVVPARADETDNVNTLRAEIEILELQQDVARSLLREAMLAAGRARFGRPVDPPDTNEAKKRAAIDAENVARFIEEKQEAVLKGSTELKKKSAALMAATLKASRPNPPSEPDDDKFRPELIEKLEEAQVELQVLNLQSQMYQQTLNEGLNELAKAEFAAGIDEAQRGTADAVRKKFNAFIRKYVDFKKRLQLGQERVAELQRRLGVGAIQGMGGFQ